MRWQKLHPALGRRTPLGSPGKPPETGWEGSFFTPQALRPGLPEAKFGPPGPNFALRTRFFAPGRLRGRKWLPWGPFGGPMRAFFWPLGGFFDPSGHRLGPPKVVFLPSDPSGGGFQGVSDPPEGVSRGFRTLQRGFPGCFRPSGGGFRGGFGPLEGVSDPLEGSSGGLRDPYRALWGGFFSSWGRPEHPLDPLEGGPRTPWGGSWGPLGGVPRGVREGSRGVFQPVERGPGPRKY